MYDAILLTNLLVNGYPYPMGSIVKVLSIVDGVALVLNAEYRQFTVNTIHLMKVPDTPIKPINRKDKPTPRRRKRRNT